MNIYITHKYLYILICLPLKFDDDLIDVLLEHQYVTSCHLTCNYYSR